MKRPNLFIVGHPRCGTSSLHSMLSQHPEIFMSKEKELHYFDRDVDQKTFELKDYLKIFEGANNFKIVGESTPAYLRSGIAAKEICNFNPHAKIVMILREPVDFLRAIYQKEISSGNEKREDIEKRILEKDYLYMTEYCEQIRRYLDNFPGGNIKIIIYDDYKNRNHQIIKEIFKFIEVDENFVPEKTESNPSRFNRFGKLNISLKKGKLSYLRKGLRNSLPVFIRKPLQRSYRKAIYKEGKLEIPGETKEELKKKLKPEVEKFNDLLHKEGFFSEERDLVKEWGYE